jgi:hypothetical protein
MTEFVLGKDGDSFEKKQGQPKEKQAEPSEGKNGSLESSLHLSARSSGPDEEQP